MGVNESKGDGADESCHVLPPALHFHDEADILELFPHSLFSFKVLLEVFPLSFFILFILLN